MIKKFAIIPAGGKGTRCKTDIPKQYLKINDKEIIAYTLEVFQNCTSIDEIIVPVESDYFNLLNEIKEKYNISKLRNIVEGGKQRQDSVYNALCALKAEDEDLITVHDAARPLLDIQLLTNAIAQATEYNSLLVAISARDTLIKAENDLITTYLDRSGVYYAQTPQIFSYKILKSSMDHAYKTGFSGTDESTIVKNAGYDVKIFEGSILNFKITTKNDIDLFKKLSKIYYSL